MTLVVAQLNDGVISAVSDTGITKHDAPLGPDHAIPKLCILSPDLAVGFSGDRDLGIRALEMFPPTAANYKEIAAHFLEFHKDHKESVDFILLFNKPIARIVKIHTGTTSPGKHAWIGCHAAFTAFQAHRNEPRSRIQSPLGAAQVFSNETSALTRPMGIQINAMRCVIDDRVIPSVFGHCVAINNVGGSFKYLSYGLVLGLRNMWLPTPDLKALDDPQFQELNTFAVSCFVADPNPTWQAIAYHYMQGKVTYLYYGRNGHPLSQARIVRDKNIKEFLQVISDELGIRWIGAVFSRNVPPNEYGMSLDQWRSGRIDRIPQAR
jgi:hypothetical protein